MLRNTLLLCIVGLLASTQGQEFGARIGKRIGRIGQSNGYFYPQPSPPFVLPVPGPQPTSPPVTTRPTTTRPVIITTPSVDYLPPATQPATTRRPTTTTPRPTFPTTVTVRTTYPTTLPIRTTPRPAPTTTRPAPTTTRPAPTTTRPAPTTTRPAPTTTRPAPTTPRPTTPRPTTPRPTTPRPTTRPVPTTTRPVTPFPTFPTFPTYQTTPIPIRTTPRPVTVPVVTTPRPTTARPTTVRSTTQPIRTTTPGLNLEYLPPATTTAGYDYPVPENPLVPGSSNQQQQQIGFPTVRPTQPTARPTQPTARPTQPTARPTQPTARPTQPTARPTQPRPVTSGPSRPSVQPVLTAEEEEILFWDFRESIAGEPEIDYPIFDKIPVTRFSCEGKINGYYADEEGRCQLFHVCSQGADGSVLQNSFLCPNGTIFSQESFACLWWHDVECQSSAKFYNLNANIGVVPESANSGNGRTVSGQSANQIKTTSSGSGIQISASAAAASSSFGGVGLTASASSGSSTLVGAAKQTSNAGYSKNSGYNY